MNTKNNERNFNDTFSVLPYWININTAASLRNIWEQLTQYCSVLMQNVTTQKLNVIIIIVSRRRDFRRVCRRLTENLVAAEMFPECCCDVSATSYDSFLTAILLKKRPHVSQHGPTQTPSTNNIWTSHTSVKSVSYRRWTLCARLCKAVKWTHRHQACQVTRRRWMSPDSFQYRALL